MSADALLATLGAVWSTADDAAGGLAEFGGDASALAPAAEDEKVARLVALRLGQLAEGETARGWIAATEAAIRARMRPSDAQLAWVTRAVAQLDAAARDLEIRLVAIKGVAMAVWYPQPDARHLNDIDLWAGSRDDALRIARGFPGTVAEEEDGVVTIDACGDDSLPIDIHHGERLIVGGTDTGSGFAGGQAGLEQRDATVATASLLGSVAASGRVRLKDLNDAWCIASAPVRWDRLRASPPALRWAAQELAARLYRASPANANRAARFRAIADSSCDRSPA